MHSENYQHSTYLRECRWVSNIVPMGQTARGNTIYNERHAPHQGKVRKADYPREMNTAHSGGVLLSKQTILP